MVKLRDLIFPSNYEGGESTRSRMSLHARYSRWIDFHVGINSFFEFSESIQMYRGSIISI
jgi:hypothetical protein